MKPAEYSNLEALEKPSRIFDLTGRVALIAGGAGKMGQQFAKTLALAGANVAIADLDKEYSLTVANKISTFTGKKILGIGVDFSEEEQISSAFKAVRDILGSIDIFIYNVMAKPDGYYRPFDEYSMKTWNTVIGGNLTGAFLGSREAAKDMKASQKGVIVLTASTYAIVGPDQRIYKDCVPKNNIYGGQYPLYQPAPYSTSKGGLISLARYLATLWGREGIRVNCLTPGGVYDGQEEVFRRAYEDRTPLGRMAEWTDYNGAILFLCSDASRYMTGSNLVVDGGWSAW